jgi:hypothetical protein
VLTSCAPGYDPVPGPTTTTDPAPADSDAAELAAARALWASVGSSDYTYEFTNDCGECLPAERSPRRVAVLEGDVLAVDEAALRTVEEVFASIEQALNEGQQVQVTYDPGTGFPNDVKINMDQRPVDGGTHWILEDLTDLNPIGSAAELLEARRIWESQGLNDYQFLMKVECDCPEKGTFDVKVFNDRVVNVDRLDRPNELSNVTPVTITQTFDDFEDWFTDTQTLIDEGILEVDIRVDPVMGYPRWVYVKAQNPTDASNLFTAVVTMDLVAPYDPGETSTEPDAGDLRSLEEARNLWAFAAIADYRYTLTIHCLCPEEHTGPFEITVKDQQIVSATWKGNPLQPGQGAAYTIDEVFNLIERTIGDGTDVDVTYDPDSGHPLSVVLDVEAVAVDGGLAFTIHSLTTIVGTGGIDGRVLAGPTCPVQKEPPDPDCADMPVTGAVMVVFDRSGNEVTRVTSNPNGFFQIVLDPGTYRIEPQPVEGLLGTAAPFELDIFAGETIEVTVFYDTGIR